MEKDTPGVPHVPMAYWSNSPIVWLFIKCGYVFTNISRITGILLGPDNTEDKIWARNQRSLNPGRKLEKFL